MKEESTHSNCDNAEGIQQPFGIFRNILLLFILILSVKSAFAQPSNDACANAIAITCGQTLFGTTIGSAFDPVSFCQDANGNTISASSAGVWYSFTGIGAQVTVSLCGAGTTYDSKLNRSDIKRL